MVEPITVATLSKLAAEGTKIAADASAFKTEVLSPLLQNTTAETRNALLSQLERVQSQFRPRMEMFNDRGRYARAVERLHEERISREFSDNVLESKRAGCLREETQFTYLKKAEGRGYLRNLEREPEFGHRRLDFRYQPTRRIFVRDRVSGERINIGAGEWIAEERKSGSLEYLIRQARGRMREQVQAALNEGHHVIVTIDAGVMNHPEAKALLDSFRKDLAVEISNNRRQVIFKGKF